MERCFCNFLFDSDMERGYLIALFFINMITAVVFHPVEQHYLTNRRFTNHETHSNIEDTSNIQDGKVISVRITSTVAVERGKAKSSKAIPDGKPEIFHITTEKPNTDTTIVIPSSFAASDKISYTDIPPNLTGANIEFIKQLNAKKEARGYDNSGFVHPFELTFKGKNNYTDKNGAEDTDKSETDVPLSLIDDIMLDDDIPLARSIGSRSKNQFNNQNGIFKSSKNFNGQRLTTVSFNIVHETPSSASFNVENRAYNEPVRSYYQEPKVYSEPSKVYSEPAKVYSEPAKIYSEPAKVYSEPAKIYSEPAKVYSEPSKFYSKHASLHLSESSTEKLPWTAYSLSTTKTNENTTSKAKTQYTEQNYEVDEKLSILSNGRSHGVQETSTENGKVGYVVEGRDYRKYMVQERTAEGFIVGEYGVVRNEDGALRGVRYTADGETSPTLIYDALMKFLQLQ